MVQPPSSAFPTAVLENDQALHGSNVIIESGQTVTELLSRLEAAPKRRLSAQDDIGDDRLDVFAKNQSTAQVMLNLARLFHATWRPAPSADVPTAYTFRYTQAAKSRAETLLHRTEDRALEPLRKLIEYLRTPAEEFARQEAEAERRKQEPKDPLLRSGNLFYLSHESPRNALALLATLPAEQWRDLLVNGYYLLPWDSLGDDQRPLAALLAAYIGKGRSKEIDHNLVRPGETPEDSVEFLRQFGLILYLGTDPLTWAVRTYGFGLGGVSYAGVQLDETPASLENLLPVRGNPYLPEQTRVVPNYPALSGMSFPADFDVYKLRNESWSVVLKELSLHTNLPIFSDHFTFLTAPVEREGKQLPVLAKIDLPGGLDALCEHYHYLWWFEGGCLYFRSRTWFIENLYEVPPRTLALLQKQLKEHGELDMQGMDALSRLTIWQLEGVAALAAHEPGAYALSRTNSMMYIRQCMIARGSARDTFGFLQIYGMLTAEEKRLAMSEAGLNLNEMTAVQRRALYMLVIIKQGSEITDPNLRVVFRITQQEQGNPESVELPPLPGKHWPVIKIQFEAVRSKPACILLLDLR